MAITIPVFSVTMTDAEFVAVNGVAAPTIPANSPFYNTFVTASSSAGTTTVTLNQTGQRNAGRQRALLTRLRNIANQYNITLTVS